MAVTLPAPPQLVIGIVVADERDFTDPEKRMLDLARPHLIQAHANAALRERLHDVLAAVEAGLDDGGEALVVADAGGRVAFATRGAGARRWTAAGAGRAARPDRARDAAEHGRRDERRRRCSSGGCRAAAGGAGATTVLVFERADPRPPRARCSRRSGCRRARPRCSSR